MQFIKKYIYAIITILVTIVFVVYKLPHLSLPYYWDEAWVYGPAVRLMAENGLSLLPDALPVDYSRGHPLLFHFLAAGWLKIFGSSLAASHSFALFISLLLVASVYYFGLKIFNEKIAFTAVMLLYAQPIFLAQSGLVLPEVMLALFTILSILFYLKRKFLLYIVFATLMLFTKETGVAFVFITFIIELIKKWKNIRTNFKDVFISLFKVSLPVLFLFLFLIIQYSYHGWFLFPEHTNFISFSFMDIVDKFTNSIGAYIFIYQGRNLLFFLSLISLIYLFIKKKEILFKNELGVLLLYVIGFMIVSSLNFFANRYVMCVIPLFIFITIIPISQLLSNKIVFYTFIIVALVLQYPFINYKSNNDHYPGYVNAVKCNMEMVDYCNTAKIKNSSVFTYFNTSRILTNPLAGYVKQENVFTNIKNEFSTNHDFYIFSNFDTPKDQWNLRENEELELVKRIEIKQAWIEIYKSRK